MQSVLRSREVSCFSLLKPRGSYACTRKRLRTCLQIVFSFGIRYARRLRPLYECRAFFRSKRYSHGANAIGLPCCSAVRLFAGYPPAIGEPEAHNVNATDTARHHVDRCFQRGEGRLRSPCDLDRQSRRRIDPGDAAFGDRGDPRSYDRPVFARALRPGEE